MTAAGRMALRVEGEWWVAYLARMGTMEGAIELGRIRLTVAQLAVVKEQFQSLMTVAFRTMLEMQGHKVERFDVARAPEHEKAGKS